MDANSGLGFGVLFLQAIKLKNRTVITRSNAFFEGFITLYLKFLFNIPNYAIKYNGLAKFRG